MATEAVQIYLTTPQKNKFEKGKAFQLSHTQLESDTGQHHVEIHLSPKDYKDLLRKAASKKGYRFDPSKVQGGSILSSIKSAGRKLGHAAKAAGHEVKDVLVKHARNAADEAFDRAGSHLMNGDFRYESVKHSAKTVAKKHYRKAKEEVKDVIKKHVKNFVDDGIQPTGSEFSGHAETEPLHGLEAGGDVNGIHPICVKTKGGRIRKVRGGKAGILDQQFSLADVGNTVKHAFTGKDLLHDKFSINQAIDTGKQVLRKVGLGLKKGSPEMREKMAALRSRRKVKGGSVSSTLKTVGRKIINSGRTVGRVLNPIIKSGVKASAPIIIPALSAAAGTAATGAMLASEFGAPLAGAAGMTAASFTDAALNHAVHSYTDGGRLHVHGGPLRFGVPMVCRDSEYNTHKHGIYRERGTGCGILHGGSMAPL